MKNDKEKSLQLQHFLPYRLYVVASRISSSLARQYEKQFNISRPEWRVLAVLAETPKLSAAQVAEQTAMDKVAVSRAVSKLVGAQYLQRSSDIDDKRKSMLLLTNKGKKMYQKIVPVALAHENKILQQLSDKEVALLTSMLEKLEALELEP